MRASEVELGDIKLFGLDWQISGSLQMIFTALLQPRSSPFSQPNESPFAPSAEERQKPEEESVISFILASPI